MQQEDKSRDYKSLRKAIGKQTDIKSLAEVCVAFANAQGGELIIGIEDKESEPPINQKIDITEVNEVVKKLRGMTDGVGLANPEIITHGNGGEYFIIQVLPSTRIIATTSSGKVFIRISDNCFPVSSDELTNLAAERTAFQWEIIAPQKISLAQVDQESIKQFVSDIQKSDKVSDFIKSKGVEEILNFYQMVSTEGLVTNLGVLWLGTPAQRARLSYPLSVQYIVYNDREEKIRKKEWHYNLHNPKELLLEIDKEAVELTYSSEIPDGLFRKTVRQYPKEVVRELLINAIAHKKYTISGDIFIEVYHDRMTITNPGSLPLGITKDNILHERHRRNPHLIQTLSDLKLMEGEGSGYDLVYEKLARDAKPLPDIFSSFTKVAVTVYSGIINTEVISILDYIEKHYQITQKEYITLGLVATEKKILSTQLATKLQLNEEDYMRSWIGTLINKGILVSQGIKKITEYLLNPELFAQAKLDIIPSLKTIEPYKLEALIAEDIKYNGKSKLSEIQKRLKEISANDIQKTVYRMVEQGKVTTEGGKRNRTYSLFKKK
ncbi:ATP-binding protein [Williamwhitmania taraxaci]|uniref:ATP-dependent DNA helicase RecG n=1 Tax=Williamwhitmania taraxaci TaxID=1640674 RepID=A0A1G6QXS3_9BACT|nr:ATP-binding protein [Williamwhitmania taraxaci]SDC97081.1 ATP-dependent DNA helicase RecG [Williamwhitmania taraxaci]